MLNLNIRNMKYIVSLLLLVSTLYTVTSAVIKTKRSIQIAGLSLKKFLKEAVRKSSPDNARLLAELFGGLELGLDLASGTTAIISVGGAATICQHQSPCYDLKCQLCYDPLLRVHGACGGASYFTCRGTLPDACLPYLCTAQTISGRNVPNLPANGVPVFLKKFSRFSDPYCLSVKPDNKSDLTVTSKSKNVTSEEEEEIRFPRGLTQEATDPLWLINVPEAATACQGYDLCLDMNCGSCYDPYLGTHVTCGKMTYYDCRINLPEECRPMKCTESNMGQIFSPHDEKSSNKSVSSPLMVRNYKPIANKVCFKAKQQ